MAWVPEFQVGNAVLVADDMRDPQSNVIVVAKGVFEIDEYLGAYPDLATADQVAFQAVRGLSGANYVRWVVLQPPGGAYYVYRAQAVRPGDELITILRDPFTPCVISSTQASLVGYHAVTYVSTLVGGNGWTRFDWNLVDGGSFSDGDEVPGTPGN